MRVVHGDDVGGHRRAYIIIVVGRDAHQLRALDQEGRVAHIGQADLIGVERQLERGRNDARPIRSDEAGTILHHFRLGGGRRLHPLERGELSHGKSNEGKPDRCGERHERRSRRQCKSGHTTVPSAGAAITLCTAKFATKSRAAPPGEDVLRIIAASGDVGGGFGRPKRGGGFGRPKRYRWLWAAKTRRASQTRYGRQPDAVETTVVGVKGQEGALEALHLPGVRVWDDGTAGRWGARFP